MFKECIMFYEYLIKIIFHLTVSKWLLPLDVYERALIIHTWGTGDALHYNDVIMSAMASQLTGVSIIFSTVKTHQRFASLIFVRGIHQRPVDSAHKGPLTHKMFPFYEVATGDAVMCQWTRTSLVQILAFLFGAKPFSEPMLDYWYLVPLKQNAIFG